MLAWKSSGLAPLPGGPSRSVTVKRAAPAKGSCRRAVGAGIAVAHAIGVDQAPPARFGPLARRGDSGGIRHVEPRPRGRCAARDTRRLERALDRPRHFHGGLVIT